MPSEVTHEPQEVFRVSQLDSSLYVDYITELEFLSDGNFVFRATYRSPALVEMNQEGEVVNIIGSEGKGPGQFLAVSSLAVTPGDTLHVFDERNARHQVFARDGSGSWELVRARSINRNRDREFLFDFPMDAFLSGEHSYLALMKNDVFFADTTNAFYHFLHGVDYNLEPEGELMALEPVQWPAIYRGEGMIATDYGGGMKEAFYRYHPGNREVYYVTNTSNEIMTIDLMGNMRVTGRLPYEHIEKDMTEINRSLNQNQSYSSDRIELIRSKYLDHEPYFRNLFLDQDRLYVQFSRSDSLAPDWSVTDLEGDIQYVFRNPLDVMIMGVNEGVLYGLRRPADGEPAITAYRLVPVE